MFAHISVLLEILAKNKHSNLFKNSAFLQYRISFDKEALV